MPMLEWFALLQLIFGLVLLFLVNVVVVSYVRSLSPLSRSQQTDQLHRPQPSRLSLPAAEQE